MNDLKVIICLINANTFNHIVNTGVIKNKMNTGRFQAYPLYHL